MAMTGAELKRIAEAGFGPEWKTPVAEHLEYTREMLWRYERGKSKIPDHIATRIRKLCHKAIEKRRDYLSGLLDKIAAAA